MITTLIIIGILALIGLAVAGLLSLIFSPYVILGILVVACLIVGPKHWKKHHKE